MERQEAVIGGEKEGKAGSSDRGGERRATASRRGEGEDDKNKKTCKGVHLFSLNRFLQLQQSTRHCAHQVFTRSPTPVGNLRLRLRMTVVTDIRHLALTRLPALSAEPCIHTSGCEFVIGKPKFVSTHGNMYSSRPLNPPNAVPCIWVNPPNAVPCILDLVYITPMNACFDGIIVTTHSRKHAHKHTQTHTYHFVD